MNRGWYWRLGLVLASLVASFVILWPSIPKASTPWVRAKIPFRLNEGLDIRGGARLSYDVQIGQAIGERRNRQMEDIREQLARDFRIHRGQERLTPDEVTRLAEKVTLAASPNNRQFTVRFRSAADVSKITDELLSNRGLVRIGNARGSIVIAAQIDDGQLELVGVGVLLHCGQLADDHPVAIPDRARFLTAKAQVVGGRQAERPVRGNLQARHGQPLGQLGDGHVDGDVIGQPF